MLGKVGWRGQVRDMRIDEPMHVIHTHVRIIANRPDRAGRKALRVVATVVAKELTDDAEASDMPSLRLHAAPVAVLDRRGGKETPFEPRRRKERAGQRYQQQRGKSGRVAAALFFENSRAGACDQV